MTKKMAAREILAFLVLVLAGTCAANVAVKWAQDSEVLFVTVGPDCTGKHDSTIKAGSLDVTCRGPKGEVHDVKGLEMREEIVPDRSQCRLLKGEVLCNLVKKEPHAFDRLTWDPAALGGAIKRDWSRWKDEDDQEAEDPYEGVKGVKALTSAALEEELKVRAAVVVDLSYPWCTMCNAKKKGFAAAAHALASDKVLFARIDAREERAAARQYNATCDAACPIRIIRKGEDVESVKSEWEEEATVKSVRTHLQPALTPLATAEDLAAFTAAHPTAIVVTLKGVPLSTADKSPEHRAVKQAALKTRGKVAVGLADKALGGLPQPSMRVFKNNTDTGRDIPPSLEASELARRFGAEGLELLEPYEYQKREAFDSLGLPIGHAFLDEGDAEARAAFEEVAKTYRGRIGFVSMGKKFDFFLKDFGLSSLPGFGLAQSFAFDALKYPHEGAITAEALTATCEAFLAGTLPPSYKTGPVPAKEWVRGSLRDFVRKNMHEVVGEKAAEDALVLVYKTWLKNYKKAEAAMRKVAEALGGVEGVTVAQIDVGSNHFDKDVWGGMEEEGGDARVFFCKKGKAEQPCTIMKGEVSQTNVFKFAARESADVKAGWEGAVKPKLKEMKEREAAKKKAEEEERERAARAAEEARKALEETIESAPKIDVTGDGGIIKQIITEGAEGGASPQAGDEVTAHYTGTLLDGSKFDSSRDRGDPFKFTVSRGQVISCWDKSFLTMKKGERAVLTCTAPNAYGERGSGAKIPPNATLRFDVELIDFVAKGGKDEL